ncbi:MAG TPA: TRAP transporter permease DctM/Q, partial [Rhodospirillales bacterium]|nr:TRAP transporter permease DctM/Q [Rhodospirillales bacterium]
MTEVRRWAERVLAALTVGFHLWLLFEGLVSNLVSRPLHMALAVPWVLLLAPCAGPVARWCGRVLGLAAIGAALWIVWNYRLLDE